MSEPLLATEANSTTEVQTGEVSDDSSSTETTEQTTQQTESTEGTEKPEGAPETYEFKNPEGISEEIVGSSIHDAYAEAARELDLPQEKAQNLFDTTMTALHRRAVEGQDRQTSEWVESARADSEFGGDKLDESLATAQKAVKEFGSDGLRELLNSPHGVGNHPEVIRFLVKVGKAVSEDRFVGGNTGQAVDPSDDATLARQLYPSSK